MGGGKEGGWVVYRDEVYRITCYSSRNASIAVQALASWSEGATLVN